MKKALYIAEYYNGDVTESYWFVGKADLLSHEEREQASQMMSVEFQITAREAREWLLEVYQVSDDMIKEVFNSYGGK